MGVLVVHETVLLVNVMFLNIQASYKGGQKVVVTGTQVAGLSRQCSDH